MKIEQQETAGEIIRSWRKIRAVSQFDLALECDTSSRHLSCIETGRAHPSRSLLLKLCNYLEIPLRVQNRVLIAADYSPRFEETGLSEPEFAEVSMLLKRIITAHEPYPAMIIEPNFTIYKSNNAFQRFVTYFIKDPELFAQDKVNLLDILFHPQGLRDAISDLQSVYKLMMARAQRMLRFSDKGGQLSAAMQRVSTYKVNTVFDAKQFASYVDMPQLMMPLSCCKGDVEVKLITTNATLGHSQNITLQELNIESAYPADIASEQFFKRLAITQG
jgi:transcriptional regulator with XRE-family HTH domain